MEGADKNEEDHDGPTQDIGQSSEARSFWTPPPGNSSYHNSTGSTPSTFPATSPETPPQSLTPPSARRTRMAPQVDGFLSSVYSLASLPTNTSMGSRTRTRFPPTSSKQEFHSLSGSEEALYRGGEGGKRKRDESKNFHVIICDGLAPSIEPNSGWALIHQPWPHIAPRVHKGTTTVYEDTDIRLQDLRKWADTFPTYQEIYEFSKSTELLRERFHTAHIGNPLGDVSFKNCFIEPMQPIVLCENDLAGLQYKFFEHLNVLLQLATRPKDGGNYIHVGGEMAARLRRAGGGAAMKKTDRTSFWFDGVHPRTSCDERHEKPSPAENVPCLIVGDYKLNGKFRYRMLAEKGQTKNANLQNVINQIHDYMDMHHCRYGYIITETELIMFRRRDENGRWGLMEFSQPIPRNAKENELNAMMVLWYFHVKYAGMNIEPGYRLDSCYKNCPEDMGGGSYTDNEWREMGYDDRPEGVPPAKRLKKPKARKNF